MVDSETVLEQARRLGFDSCREFDAGLLVPEERIRACCLENRCGCYNAHHMCPPRVGPLPEIQARLRRFERGVLLQVSRPADVARDREAVVRAKLELHHLVLRLERRLRRRRLRGLWAMIGGSCQLCPACAAVEEKPCRHPQKARTSLEALGIDVVALQQKLGLDAAFHPDRITWTGCILFGDSHPAGGSGPSR